MGGSGILLIAMIGGYWVLERAQGHKSMALKRVGQLVGWFVILASAAGIFCMANCAAGHQCGKGRWMKKGGMCPLTGRLQSPPEMAPSASPVE